MEDGCVPPEGVILGRRYGRYQPSDLVGVAKFVRPVSIRLNGRGVDILALAAATDTRERLMVQKRLVLAPQFYTCLAALGTGVRSRRGRRTVVDRLARVYDWRHYWYFLSDVGSLAGEFLSSHYITNSSHLSIDAYINICYTGSNYVRRHDNSW